MHQQIEETTATKLSLPWRGQSGMTLVEVMVATLLLSMFIAIAYRVILQTADALEAARRYGEAVALGWNRMERARHVGFDNIDDLAEPRPGTVVDARGVPDIDGGFRRSTSVTTMTNGLVMKHISVDVWPRNRRTRAFVGAPRTVETVIAQVDRAGGME